MFPFYWQVLLHYMSQQRLISAWMRQLHVNKEDTNQQCPVVLFQAAEQISMANYLKD